MEHPPYTAETFTTTHQRLRVKHVVKSYHTRWIMYCRILLCHKRCCQRSPWSERDSWPGRIWGVCWPYCQRTMLSVVCVQQTAPAAKWMKKESEKQMKSNRTKALFKNKSLSRHDRKVCSLMYVLLWLFDIFQQLQKKTEYACGTDSKGLSCFSWILFHGVTDMSPECWQSGNRVLKTVVYFTLHS